MNQNLTQEEREKVEEIVQFIEEQGGMIEEVWADNDMPGARAEVTFRI